ncbi:MAG: LURP-one-related family protein [Clostridia bacterium]|nr:LURP-one-related family protein [Clostridia bacterium]
MKLLFKQKAFSWFDSYDVFNEHDEAVYKVKGQLSWGHCLKIFDAQGNEIGTVKERIISFLPKFEMYLGENYLGCIKKEFSFFTPKFTIECNNWQVEGDFFEWDYSITDTNGNTVATVSKDVFRWTDTYVIDVENPQNVLEVLMLVIAIDAEKCSRK